MSPLHWQHWCNLTPLALGAGLLLPHALSITIAPMVGVAIVPLIMLCIAIRSRASLLQPLLMLAIALLGVWLSSWQLMSLNTPMLSRSYWMMDVQATVDDVLTGEGKQKLVLSHLQSNRLNPEDAAVRLRVSVRLNGLKLHAGDRVRLRLTAFPPSRPTHPDGFDFGRYFTLRGIGGVGYGVGKPELLFPASLQKKGIAAQSDQLFTRWRSQIEEEVMTTLPQPEAGITLALITGEQGRITDDVRVVMQNSSLAHLLAISGMNMVIVCGIVFYIVRLALACIPVLALRSPIKQVAALAALLSGAMYLLLADMPVSAARAYVMVAFYFGAMLCKREADTLRSLVLAAWVILLVNPASITEISFQLSFVATLALILVYRRVRGMNEMLRAKEKSWGWRAGAYVLQIAFTSLVAGLATAPLMIYHFNHFTPYGIVANVLASPLITFITSPLLIVALIAAPFGLHAVTLQWAGVGVSGMVAIGEWVAALPYASIPLPSISTFALCAMMLSLSAMLWCHRVWQRLVFLTFACVLALSGWAKVQPDILMAEDGSAVAVKVDADAWVLLKGTPRNFHATQWQQITTGIFTPYAQAVKQGAQHGWVCRDTWCEGMVRGKRVRLGMDYTSPAKLCKPDTDILLTSFYSNRRECEAKGALRIDKDALERLGAHALWVEGDSVRIWHPCSTRQHQPWMRCAVE
jgi:competence protein ComEC